MRQATSVKLRIEEMDPDLDVLRAIPDLDVPDSSPVGPAPVVATVVADTRVNYRRRRLIAITLSCAWMAGHVWMYGVRADLPRLPAWYLLAQIFLPLGLAALAAFAAFASGKAGLGLKLPLLRSLAIAAPLVFTLTAMSAPFELDADFGAKFWLDALICFDITVAWTAIPLLAAIVGVRRAFPTAPAWRSALVGAACGLFSGATMNLHCPNADSLHMAIGHGLPVFIATVLGGFVLVSLASIE